ncbi:helical backbone metal receptor [Epilithonimonas arachidiradicis]|uniref:ABC-type Fe3+-hydroxamate transport system substrate-binding protein n=1 Tax=Epilithonimonas arachidiradicis TaxID=1617282 RepID=A0A420CPN7_9FLAO|nr:helical backbone metal receptor [Epilithonimonas arachidiradicis]RKE80383.1 ABC-type Fe3+-hydroxamate transport system substrate-binding protein [Epilithonimonas arachidiradicis]GGG64087.1 iron ABC transporter [Epilithonimonas arachidiradicis]
MRVISLVPSITEALFDLGLATDEIVGRTKFCIHPKDLVREVEIIGGTKNLNLDKIKSLKPDLIIANKEENVKEQVEELMKDFRVLVTNVDTLEDNYYLLKQLAHLFGKEEKAQFFNLKTYEAFDITRSEKPLKVAYLIWKNPYMTVGGDTFISRILEELGFENLFKNQKRYPEIQLEDLKVADLIFLSSEPFPFKEQHIDEIREVCQNQKILIVDGEAFSWYGTHLAKCGKYYRELLKNV